MIDKDIDLETKLSNIFKTRLGIDFEGKLLNEKSEHLLGSRIKLNARDLLYLYFDIEKEFNIIIPEEEVIRGNFSSFNKIAGIVQRQLNRGYDINSNEPGEAAI